MQIFVYRNGAGEVGEGFTAADLPGLLAEKTNVVWVDFLGETPDQREEAKNILLNVFKFHHLTVEDCMETRNQPKLEAFPDYLYLIVHGIKSEETSSVNFVTKELDAFLGDNFVVTFHLERFRAIKKVKEQIHVTPFACQRGAAYLLHQILDHIVDLYMPVVEDFDNSINELEDRIFLMKNRSENKILEEIMDLRRSVARLKRISSRQLDVLYRISHGEFPQIPANVLPFYRDVYDHLQRISDLSENYRDLVSGLFDVHFSVITNKTNDVIKFLTIFSAIWLPLSFIAGVYGMNFENMPELKTIYGYFITLGLMALVALSLVGYFWHKGWIFEGRETEKEREDGEKIHKTQVND
ncbi:MAG: magnesium/cobalt transporter CorA [Pyrinomonadaceae bacterium]|nr:magnesium/cobalt transporter CorA [Pyrinomonadaceae bacterium]